MEYCTAHCRRQSNASPERAPGILASVVWLLLSCLATESSAGAKEQAERLHSRLTGVPPSAAILEQMAQQIESGNARSAAELAIEQPEFYDVTLKRLATPWTTEGRSVFEPLNDYSATVIGTVRDDLDFREILWQDRQYVGRPDLGLPPASASDNRHYEALEAAGIPLKDALIAVPQSQLGPLPPEATAGVITSRAAAKAFLIAGTNRAMVRFLFVNHLCHDMEQMKDNTRPADRIRQDVSRSPGGDSRLFLNNCLACHAGLDPLAQAFAYYDYRHDVDNDPDGQFGQITYHRPGDTDPATGTRVVGKYLINADTFKYGYVTRDDHWSNYWRAGQNAAAGWSTDLPGEGDGARSLGQELASSGYFAECQARQAFEQVCLRPPASESDRRQLTEITRRFVDSGYHYKTAFVESAVYCMGE